MTMFHIKNSFLKMPGIKALTSICLVVIALSSCQKTIDIKLNDTQKKYVIEAIVTDQTDSSKVLLTQTKNFSEDNQFPGVSGATVTVTDGGVTTNFVQTAPGVYKPAAGFKGVVGHTYTLSLTVGGTTFTAASTMPAKVNFDSVYTTDEFLFGENRKLVTVDYQEPLGKGNNYRFVQYVNGLKEPTVFVNNDDYTDGKQVADRLFYFADDDHENHKIKTGNTVIVEMLCIDAGTYMYWFSLGQSATGTSQSASPANPVTNIKGGALGYFSAQTYQKKTFVAK